MSIEHNENKAENSEFIAPNNEVTKPEANPDSKIGKPIEERASTPEEKAEAQKILVEKIQKRVDEMKENLSKMEEMLPMVKSVEDNKYQADKKEQELLTLIRNQLQSGEQGYEENIAEQERVQQEITEHRKTATETRNEVFSKLPNGQREVSELDTKIYHLKQDLAKEEDILKSNQEELERSNQST